VTARTATAAFFALSAALPAQPVFRVDNLADAGPGSLRAAMTAANSSGQAAAVIEVRVAGTIVLGSGTLPALVSSRAVEITRVGTSGRLEIDARAVTAQSAGYGLAMHGAGSAILAPLTILVQRGTGFLARAAHVRVLDLEVRGGDSQGFLADRADDLTVERLHVTGAGRGVLVLDCARARLATGGAGLVTVTDCSGYGIIVSGGTDNAVAAFVSERNDIGVLVADTVGVALGGVGRSAASDNAVHGVMLTRVRNGGAPALRDAELQRNDGQGLMIEGGSELVVRDVLVDGNLQGGITLYGGAAQVTVGPGVVTRGSPGTFQLPAAGLGVRDARDIIVTDSAFGPGNGWGVSINAAHNTPPGNVVLRRVQVTGNGRGVEVVGAAFLTVEDAAIEANFGVGLDMARASDITVQGTVVRQNVDYGVVADVVQRLRIGPGNRIDDNQHHAGYFRGCAGMQFVDNPSISRNRGAGIEVREGRGATIRNCTFAANSGVSLWILEGAEDAVVGPGVVVRDAFGTGIRVETVGNVLLQGCVVASCSSSGIDVLAHDRPALQSCRISSCLIVDSPGIGLRLRHSPRLYVDTSTIARNYIGLHASTAYRGVPTVAEVDSCILWDNTLFDHVAAEGAGVDARNSFFVRPEPAGGGNRRDDPRLVDPFARDYRLRPGSPAIDAGSAGLTFPAGARDAWDQPRIAGARVDCGAFEAQAAQPVLQLSASRMPPGGGELAFHLLYPLADAGAVSVLLCEVGRASGSFPLLGAIVPLGLTPNLLLLATDPANPGALAFVPPSGAVNGRIGWTGRLPPSLPPFTMSLCAVSIAGVTRTVTNVATFDVR
jgi:hypothetical protein